MKNKIAIILIFISLSLNSQSLFKSYEKGTITFRNGEEKTGFIKISISDKIKFKKTKKDKKIVLGHKKVKKIKFLYGDEYLYKISVKSSRVLLIKRQIIGKLELYSYERSSPGLMTPNGMMMGGNTSTAYLIGKRDSDLIEPLPMNPKKNKFRKIMMKYASDCPEFLKLIKDKKSVKENFAKDYSGFFLNQGTAAVEDMINFYNENCN